MRAERQNEKHEEISTISSEGFSYMARDIRKERWRKREINMLSLCSIGEAQWDGYRTAYSQ